MFDLEQYIQEKCKAVDAHLDSILPPEDLVPIELHRAMRYSVFPGGKRLRPVICLAAAEAVAGDGSNAMMSALALELLHTYTLIHDDLPCMDDDDLRRGKASSHKVFGEATAVLAGDALQALAFECIGRADSHSSSAGTLTLELASAAGSMGVVGGQVEDLASEDATPDRTVLERIHSRKTAALFVAAARMGGITAGASGAVLEGLTAYGRSVGRVFQLVDDILNVTSSTEELGKAVGNDAAKGKMTAVGVMGLNASRQAVKDLISESEASLRVLGDSAGLLLRIAKLMADRKK